MARRVEALLFDLGGVLVEVEWRRAFDFWSERSGVPADELAKRFRRDATYEAHECGTLSDADFFSALRRSLGIPLTEAEMRQGWNSILGDPYPGVPALLERVAKDRPVHVFSNTNKAHADWWRPRYRTLLAPVREVLVSCEIGRRKPDPEAFRRVAERLGVSPARIAFFDDLEENVAGARAAGLRAYHVPSPSLLEELLAEVK